MPEANRQIQLFHRCTGKPSFDRMRGFYWALLAAVHQLPWAALTRALSALHHELEISVFHVISQACLPVLSFNSIAFSIILSTKP